MNDNNSDSMKMIKIIKSWKTTPKILNIECKLETELLISVLLEIKRNYNWLWLPKLLYKSMSFLKYLNIELVEK